MLSSVTPSRSEKKLIGLLTLVFIGFWLIVIYKYIAVLANAGKSPVMTAISTYVLLFIYLPVTAYLFFKGKKWGWILAQVYFTYSFPAVLVGIYVNQLGDAVLPHVHDSEPASGSLLSNLFIAL